MSPAPDLPEGVQPMLSDFELPSQPKSSPPVAIDFGYSSQQVLKIVDITYRQLDHWDRTGFISPSAQKAAGSGSRRVYSYQDLLRFRLAKRLLEGGVNFTALVKIFEYIEEELGDNILTANLVIEGQQVYYVRDGEAILDLLRRGQGVLNLIWVPAIVNEVDGKLVEMFSSRQAEATDGIGAADGIGATGGIGATDGAGAADRTDGVDGSVGWAAQA